MFCCIHIIRWKISDTILCSTNVIFEIWMVNKWKLILTFHSAQWVRVLRRWYGDSTSFTEELLNQSRADSSKLFSVQAWTVHLEDLQQILWTKAPLHTHYNESKSREIVFSLLGHMTFHFKSKTIFIKLFSLLLVSEAFLLNSGNCLLEFCSVDPS